MKISLTKNWREELQESGIRYIPEKGFEEVFGLIGRGWLPVTSCSKTKGNIARGTPKQFYISERNKRFYGWAEHHSFVYGILSDKYGLFFHDEIKDWYDVHPSSLGDDDFKKLGKEIKRAAVGRKIKGLIFWNSSPFMSVPYFKMMKCSGASIVFITKLIYRTTRKGFF